MFQHKSTLSQFLNRVQDLLDKQLLEEQAGFRSNRSTVDQLFTLKMVMEKSRDLNKPLHMCFIEIFFGVYVVTMASPKT